MNETHIQTIRGGIQRVMHLAKDHWTQEPTRCGFNYYHELYGYIPVSKLAKLIREARNETWEEYAWLCYENRYLTLEQMAAQMLECGSFTEFSTLLHETFEQESQTEQLHTVAKVFVNIDGTKYRSICPSKGETEMGNTTEITLKQARDMIRSIDSRLIPECRDFDTYTETDEIWRIGGYGYVDADVYEQAFRDYEARNGETEWARPMYVLEGNQPNRLEYFVEAYNLGGMPMLNGLLDAQFDNGDADEVYLTNGEAWPI